MSTGATPPVERASDLGKGPQGEAARWLAEIDLFESENKPQFERFEKILKRYRNESWRDDIPAATGADARGRGFAMFWANVETLKPTIYAQAPKADVQRRWKDKDPVARVASEVLERCLDYFIDQDAFRDTVINCRDDYLIVGQGVQWHRYVPHFHDVKLRVPVRKAVGRGDGTEKTADTTGPGVPDQGLQVTNDAEAYESDESDAYESPDSEGNYSAVDPKEKVLTGDNGLYVERIQQEIKSEEWVPDYVYWRDFGWTPGARTWSEVYCVWRKCYMTRDELVDRFGKEVGEAVRLDWSGPKSQGQDSSDTKKQFYKKATIYEIWDSTTRKTHWLARAYDGDLLDTRPYPLKLTGRFPCQKPIFATQTNGQVSPVPDYLQYQDQAQELDKLTQRIYTLMDAIQVKYLYAGNMTDLQDLLQNSGENDGTPVQTDLLALFGGDINKAVWFFPLDMMVKALNELMQARERVKQDAYEITGIADIIRGASDPNETLGAQELKAQSSSIRIKDRQKNFADFVRGALRIGSDIIVNHFQPETIVEICDLKTIPEADHVRGPNGQWMSPADLQAMLAAQAKEQMAQQQMQPPVQGGMMGAPGGSPSPLPPSGGSLAPPPPGALPPQMGHNGGPPMSTETLGQAAIALLKDPLQRQFRIDIETDSTVALDENSEKAARIEFVTAIGQFLEAAVQISATPMGAELAPLLGEILLFSVRGFKVGTQLEGAIETVIEQLQAKAKNPPPPPPDPAMVKAQADAAASKAQAENDARKTQGDLAIQQAEAQHEGQAHQQEMAADAQTRQGEMVAEAQRAHTDARAQAMDLVGKRMDIAGKGIDLEIAQERLKEAKKPKPTNGVAG